MRGVAARFARLVEVAYAPLSCRTSELGGRHVAVGVAQSG